MKLDFYRVSRTWRSLKVNNYKILGSAVAGLIFFRLIFWLFDSSETSSKRTFETSSDNQRCYHLYRELLSFYQTIGVNRPSSHSLTPDLIKNFELMDLPIRTVWTTDDYFNSFSKNKINIQVVQNSEINALMRSIKLKKAYNQFEDLYLEEMLEKYLAPVKKRSRNVGIFGLYETKWTPWIESLLLSYNVPTLTSIDLSRKIYDRKEVVNFYTYEYLKAKVLKYYRLKKNEAFDESFDMIVSYMAMDRIGLGKIGETVSINADVDTINQLYCMLKKNGLLFLTINYNSDEETSYVEFNNRRVYGTKRLEVLFTDWTVLDEKVTHMGRRKIYVLQKV